MNNENSSQGLKEISVTALQSINGIKFTCRQVDVMACLISGWGVKTIADRLKISPSTVESHIDNIIQKLGSSGRSSILSFIEQSGQDDNFRRYYKVLMEQNGNIKNQKAAHNFTTSPTFLLLQKEKKRRRFKSIILIITIALNILGLIPLYPTIINYFFSSKKIVKEPSA